MIPSKDELLPYANDKKLAAQTFDVSERTIVNWLKKYDLYHPKANYGCGKLDMSKASEIRRLYREGKTMKELAATYHVTFSTISRVIHNLIYAQIKEVADVSVVYNPATFLGSSHADPLVAGTPSGDSL